MWLFGGSGNKKQEETPAAAAPASEFVSESNDNTNAITATSGFQFAGIPSFDASKLHPLAGLEKDLEYLDLDEEKLSTIEGTGNGILPSRGWSDDMCYGTGTLYLGGLGLGGLIGLNEGFKTLPRGTTDPVTGVVKAAPFKLKLNTVLNQVTKHGPHMGNSAGTLGLMYNIIDSSLDMYRGKHDDINSLVSGALTGAIFKSTSGVKAMGISTGLMTLAAASWCGFKRMIN
jgi:import inner membrane translocase subunit TIM23